MWDSWCSTLICACVICSSFIQSLSWFCPAVLRVISLSSVAIIIIVCRGAMENWGHFHHISPPSCSHRHRLRTHESYAAENVMNDMEQWKKVHHPLPPPFLHTACACVYGSFVIKNWLEFELCVIYHQIKNFCFVWLSLELANGHCAGVTRNEIISYFSVVDVVVHFFSPFWLICAYKWRRWLRFLRWSLVRANTEASFGTQCAHVRSIYRKNCGVISLLIFSFNSISCVRTMTRTTHRVHTHSTHSLSNLPYYVVRVEVFFLLLYSRRAFVASISSFIMM